MPRRVYDLFFSPGEVAEIRAIGCSGKNAAWEGFCRGVPGIVSGYFDNAEDFEKAGVGLDKARPAGVYFTLNPVNPSLLARAVNRLIASPKSTTTDKDTKVLRWLPVDLDPIRPSGISSSDEELKAAEDLAREITKWLEEEMGFERGLRACSGNGYHLTYRLPDLPNDEIHQALVTQALEAIEAKFHNDRVEIDLKVFNPARIWKVYGTTGRKGDSTAERPHRQSYLFKEQPATLAEVPVCSLKMLKILAALAPKDPQPASPYPQKTGHSLDRMKGDLGTLDLGAYLGAFGRAHRVRQDGSTRRYELEECVFDPNHKRYEASICQSPSPPFLTYQCFHTSCDGKTWRKARAEISGAESLAPFCANYDPGWQAPQEVGSGLLKDISVEPSESLAIQGAAVPAPAEIDPSEFYEKRGKRAVFVPMRMAKYFGAYLGHIVHTDGLFWRYKDGRWKQFSRHVLAQICVTALKEFTQASWIDNSIKIFAGLVNREEEQWPKRKDLVNCLNGMVDIGTGKLLAHDPKYGSKTQIPCTFGWDAKYERWAKFLDEVFPDQPGKQDILQQFFGYCLLTDCRFHKAIFLYGTGANGKSTALNALQAVVGRENTATLTIGDLSQRFKIQFLEQKLVNLATETNTSDPISTEIFKAVVAGDSVTAERKYGEPYLFTPYAKFIVAMNESPVIPDKSYGLGRRIIVLDFPRRFKDEEMDPYLSDELIREKDGIFMWALLGLEKLLGNRGFVIPEDVKQDTRNLLSTMNPFLIFVEECLELGEGGSMQTTSAYGEYLDWCKEGRNRPLSRNRFIDQVLMNFPSVKKKPHGETRRMHFIGICKKLIL